MSLKIETERLELVAETSELADAEAAGNRELSAALDASVPEWPPEGIADALELFASLLRRDPTMAGWLIWYWILVDPTTGRRTLIGSGGFTSPPLKGTVATGYSLLARLPWKRVCDGSRQGADGLGVQPPKGAEDRSGDPA